jgi:pimeloyl-ACP methyl ester carboxylesterase
MKKEIINLKDNKIAIYDSEGDGQIVILIHGNSLSSKSFKPQMEGALGKNFHLIAIDLPGHGNSSPFNDPRNNYSVPGYGKVITGVINQLNLLNVVLVGHSLGGHIALEMSEMLPTIKGIFIFGTPPLGIPPNVNQAFLDVRLRPALLVKEGSEIPQFFIDDMDNTDPDARKFMMRNTAKNKFIDEINIISKLKIPLAIIHGIHDQAINLEYIKKLEMPSLWRNKIQIIENAGHSPQWETPNEFNTLLEEFLEELS